MAIKQLDQDGIDSIYNRLVFTSKSDSVSLDKKSVVSMSNRLTDTQNYFNILETSFGNIKKLNDFKVKRDKQLALERTIEAVGPSSASRLSGLSVDFSSTIRGFGILSKQLEVLNEKLEELDFSSGSGDASDVDEDDDDIDIKRKSRGTGRGGRRGGRFGRGGLGRLGGRFLGVFGVGLDVADRASEGQSATKIAVGVGGGMAGAAAGGAAGAAIGALGGPAAIVTAPLGGLIGGALGYFGGSTVADKTYDEISKSSYSPRFADFLRGTISNIVAASPMLASAGFIAGKIGDYFLPDPFKGGELPPDAGVLDAIAKAEGTYGTGYNTSLGYGQYLPGGKEQNLTDKTLDEILQLGDYMRKQKGNPNSSALGRYQIVGTTLKDAAKSLKLDLNTTKFTPEVQDRMAMWILKKQGFKAWEGFKGNPQYLQIAQAALAQNRIKSSSFSTTMTGVGTLDTAKKWLGLSEGNAADSLNQFIRTYYGPFDVKSTPWCAAFVNAVLGSQGFYGTGSAAAVSFRNYGSLVWDRDVGGNILAASKGDIGFFRRSSGTGHVAFIDSIDVNAGTVTYVGGNQSDKNSGGQVSRATVKIDDPTNGLVAIRRPGGDMGQTPNPQNKLSVEAITPFRTLLKPTPTPKKKNKQKTVVVETPIAYPVFLGQKSGLLPKPLVAKGSSGKSTDYYTGRRR